MANMTPEKMKGIDSRDTRFFVIEADDKVTVYKGPISHTVAAIADDGPYAAGLIVEVPSLDKDDFSSVHLWSARHEEGTQSGSMGYRLDGGCLTILSSRGTTVHAYGPNAWLEVNRSGGHTVLVDSDGQRADSPWS